MRRLKTGYHQGSSQTQSANGMEQRRGGYPCWRDALALAGLSAALLAKATLLAPHAHARDSAANPASASQMDRSQDLDGFLAAAVAALGNHKRHDLGVWLALAVDAFQTVSRSRRRHRFGSSRSPAEYQRPRRGNRTAQHREADLPLRDIRNRREPSISAGLRGIDRRNGSAASTSCGRRGSRTDDLAASHKG
jgi:dsDNA-binding SOS-regulon protein